MHLILLLEQLKNTRALPPNPLMSRLSLSTAEGPTVESGDGERRAFGPGQLHLCGPEQIRHHHAHLPAGRTG